MIVCAQAALTTHDWEDNSTWIIAVARLVQAVERIPAKIRRADVAGAANSMAQLQLAQAEELMEEILAIMDDEIVKIVRAIVAEVDALPPQHREAHKAARLLPLAQQLSAPVLEANGFEKEQFMAFWMQLQLFACSSPAIQTGVARMMGVVG